MFKKEQALIFKSTNPGVIIEGGKKHKNKLRESPAQIKKKKKLNQSENISKLTNNTTLI